MPINILCVALRKKCPWSNTSLHYFVVSFVFFPVLVMVLESP